MLTPRSVPFIATWTVLLAFVTGCVERSPDLARGTGPTATPTPTCSGIAVIYSLEPDVDVALSAQEDRRYHGRVEAVTVTYGDPTTDREIKEVVERPWTKTIRCVERGTPVWLEAETAADARLACRIEIEDREGGGGVADYGDRSCRSNHAAYP